VDPLADETGTPYAYTGGDPVNSGDPNGLCDVPSGNSNRPFTHTHNGACTEAEAYLIETQAKAINQGTSIYASEEAPSSNQSAWTTLVQGLDPAYLAINSYYNEWQATENGCGLSTEAKYGAEGVAGVGITALTAVGAGEAAGFIESPDAWLDVGQRGFHIHYDTVPHGEIGSHLQIDTWLKGVSGSGTSLRVPWPPW